jgi:hypothetical protein
MNASIPLCAIIKSSIYLPLNIYIFYFYCKFTIYSPLMQYVHTYICACVCNWERKENEKHFQYQ